MQDFILDLLIIIIPSGAVVLTVYLVLKAMFDNEQKKELLKINKQKKTQSVPMRLQAYERMALFLERITPSSMIHRMNAGGMTSTQYHLALLSNVRSEFEHNLSQQIYIESNTWETIRQAKEEIVRVINEAAAQVAPEAPAMDLNKAIVARVAQFGNKPLPNMIALSVLKKEVAQLY